VVLCVNAISLSLVDDSPLIKQVVPALEGYHLLQLGVRPVFVHERVPVHVLYGLSDAWISHHVICKVVQGGTVLLELGLSLNYVWLSPHKVGLSLNQVWLSLYNSTSDYQVLVIGLVRAHWLTNILILGYHGGVRIYIYCVRKGRLIHYGSLLHSHLLSVFFDRKFA
jgi:hypothetical protein